MSDILTTLSTTDWSSIYAILMTFIGAISAIIAGIQTKFRKDDMKNVNDLMNPTTETTEAQKQLIKDGKISDGAWKMNSATRTELYTRLTNMGASVNRSALDWAINKAEEECNVEYVIRCFTYTQGTELDAEPAAFISYGTILAVASWTEIKAIATEHKETEFYSIS